MHPDGQKDFPSLPAGLKDGRAVTLRLLQATDGNMLAALYAAVPAADNHFYCPHPLDRAHALRNAADADNPCNIVLVAETPEREFAGYAWVRWQSANAGKSNFGICVRPDYQGNGTGRALMSRLFEIARRFSPPVIRLTVQQSNPRGVQLYQKMGFKIVREQMRGPIPSLGLPAEPEYVMELAIR